MDVRCELTRNLERELCKVTNEIDALYWKFTRCAAAKPPAVVRSDLYQRRAAISRRLCELRMEQRLKRPVARA